MHIVPYTRVHNLMHVQTIRTFLRSVGFICIGTVIGLLPTSAHADSPSEYLQSFQADYRVEQVYMSAEGHTFMATAVPKTCTLIKKATAKHSKSLRHKTPSSLRLQLLERMLLARS